MKALGRLALLCIVALGILAAPAAPAQAEDLPGFWTGPNNGAWMTVLAHGDVVIPYVVAHPDCAQVECFLRVYDVKGPNWTLVRELPLGAQTAVPSDFCNIGSGALPLHYTWTDVDLDPGGYRCKVAATDGTRWAVNDIWCSLGVTTTPDITPPVTTTDYDGLPHNSVTIKLSRSDDRGGWGVMGGLATTEYRLDGGPWIAGSPWITGASVTLRSPIRHKLRGVSRGDHLLEYRSTDYAGNVEEIRSCTVRIG